MLRLILFLVIAAALAWTAVWIANHPGTVEVQWLGYELVLNIGVVLVGVLLFTAAIIVLFELFRVLRGLPARMRRSRAIRQEKRGYQELSRGLMAAAAGDLASARSHHRHAERYLPNHGALLLLAAQNAQLEGKEEVAHLKFRQMLDHRDTEFVGLRGLLGQAMKAGDQDEALQLARRAYRRSPTTPWVLTTLFELLARKEKWDEALGLVNEMQSQRLLDDAQAKRRRGMLHHMTATELREKGRIDEAVNHARRAVKNAPDFVPGVVQMAELSLQQGSRRQAVRALEDCWRLNPHPDVARAYVQLETGENPAQRLQRISKRLVPLNPDHPETLLLQGELAIQAHDWELARSRLEQARVIEPTPRVYRLLAELERSAHGDNARAQEWLARAVDAQPDRAWVCEDTGEVVPAWRPFAPSGRFDAVHWSTPPRVATLIGKEQTSYMVAHEERAEAEPEGSKTRAPAGSPPGGTVEMAVAG